MNPELREWLVALVNKVTHPLFGCTLIRISHRITGEFIDWHWMKWR